MVIFKAILFDLDDTLLNRDKAVDKMFLMILDRFYEGVKDSSKYEMLLKFREYDSREYGNADKTKVFESFFDEFPPNNSLKHDHLQDFWNLNFPDCFSIDQNTINIVNALKKHVKVAIITNGSTQRQKAKITNTNLNSCFDMVFISEEVGYSKPDKLIFEWALNNLNVQPEEALFVGDDIEKDIGGCQNADIKGIWFNPNKNQNDTEIKPYDEIHSLERLLNYLT